MSTFSHLGHPSPLPLALCLFFTTFMKDAYCIIHFFVSVYRFKPPDACYIELMRFRVRPPRNRELPIQLKAVMCVTGNKVKQCVQKIVILLKNLLRFNIYFICTILINSAYCREISLVTVTIYSYVKWLSPDDWMWTHWKYSIYSYVIQF